MSKTSRYEWRDQQASLNARMKGFQLNPGAEQMEALEHGVRAGVVDGRAVLPVRWAVDCSNGFGEPPWVRVEVSTARFVDEEGPAILAMLRDISERKRLQEQLRKTERIAELGGAAIIIVSACAALNRRTLRQ